MTTERIPLPGRPGFARKMIAVWRLHHLTNGEDLTVTVWPGEWPADAAREVKGVPVVEDDRIGGKGAVMVLGRVGDMWRAAYNLAVVPFAGVAPVDLAVATAFMEVGEDPGSNIKLWLHPDPADGTVPMWEIPRRIPS